MSGKNNNRFYPSQESIYFNTLTTDMKYLTRQAMSVTNDSLLNKNGNFTKRSLSKYQTALKILENGISTERSNEEAYFSSILSSSVSKLNNETRKYLSSKLKAIFNQSSFDYMEFIELINQLLLGKDQYEKILKYEQERLELIQKARNNLADYKEIIIKKKKGKETEDIKLSGTEIEEYFRKEYLEKHTPQAFRGFFQGIGPTIDNVLNNFVNQEITKAMQSKEVLEKAKTIICDPANPGWEEVKMLILKNVMTNSLEPQVIDQLIGKQKDTGKEEINKIIDGFISSMSNKMNNILIKNLSAENYEKKSFKQLFIDEKNNSVQVLGEGLGEFFLSSPETQALFKDRIKDNKKLTTLIENYNKAIQQEQLSQNDKEVKNTQDEKRKSRGSSIELGKLSTFLKQSLQESFDQELDPVKIANDFKQALISKTLTITGPQYSELISNVIMQIKANGVDTYALGKENYKADSIHIISTPVKLTTYSNLANQSKGKLTKMLNFNQSTFHDTFQKSFMSNLSTKETDYKQGKKSWFDAIDKTQKEIANQIQKTMDKDTNEQQAMQAAAEYLKNSIVVTETDKTFNLYQNDIGFVSGSLGGNLQSQLNNIAELFNSAGVGLSSKEVDWLMVALVNCSPYALGAGNRTPLEKYLSTLIGFAIFDEGSAEISLLTNQAKEEYQQSSPKLLHLYRLNGLYFPGSFILSRIREGLETNLNEAMGEMTSSDGAKINASASPEIIQRTGTLSDQWKATYKTASSPQYTSIEVTFLSGLLNIINNLLPST